MPSLAIVRYFHQATKHIAFFKAVQTPFECHHNAT